MTERLPEPTGWLASALLDCLRKWQGRALGGKMLVLTDEDLSQLERWASELWQAWQQTAESLRRCGIKVETYPVQVDRGGTIHPL